VLQVFAQERKRSRTKIIAMAGLAISVASYFGHQYVKGVIADGISKATPIVEAKIMAHLDQTVSEELPTMIARSEERVFPQIAGQLKANHQKRMRELEEAYERQARMDEERFKANIAAAQPTLSGYGAQLPLPDSEHHRFEYIFKYGSSVFGDHKGHRQFV
jgi:hypothetical protein